MDQATAFENEPARQDRALAVDSETPFQVLESENSIHPYQVKVWATSCDSRLGLNPMVARLFNAIPGIELQSYVMPDTQAIFLSWIAAPQIFTQDTSAIRAIVDSKKPVIIFDHMETTADNFLLGRDNPPGNVYDELNNAASFMNVRAYFKRELLSNKPFAWEAPKFPVYPLDWILQTNGERHIPVSRESFEARPIDIFFSWGYSSESRPKMMGELLKQAGRFGAHFCLTEQDLDIALEERRQRIFALLHTPHYRRIHIAKLMKWQEQAKVSISMRGAGRKCFRDAEASFNCVMARQNVQEVLWSYPWQCDLTEGFSGNCINLGGLANDADYPEEEFNVDLLYEAIRVHQGSLYDLYLAGVENNKRYHADVYGREYLSPRIKEALK